MSVSDNQKLTQKMFSRLQHRQPRKLTMKRENYPESTKTLLKRPKSMHIQIRSSDNSQNLHNCEFSWRRTWNSEHIQKRSSTAMPKHQKTQKSIKYLHVNRSCLKKISNFSHINNYNPTQTKFVIKQYQIMSDMPIQSIYTDKKQNKYITKGLRTGKKIFRPKTQAYQDEQNQVKVVGFKIF